MKINDIIPETHFVQFNLSDMLDELGEDNVKEILSSFSCPMNTDVENFLRYKAIEFSKRGFAKTHIAVSYTHLNKTLAKSRDPLVRVRGPVKPAGPQYGNDGSLSCASESKAG